MCLLIYKFGLLIVELISFDTKYDKYEIGGTNPEWDQWLNMISTIPIDFIPKIP